MNLEFTVPPNITFEQAMDLTQDLLVSNPSDALLESAITTLLQTQNGARGFFVVFLTGNSALADVPTPPLLRALRSNPDAIADLMVKNIAMPTAMALTHQRNGNDELAVSSNQTQVRSIHLVQQLNLSEITTLLRSMQSTIQNNNGTYQSFLDRWGYDLEQRSAIGQVLARMLA
jgi:hypothetical protein